MIQSIPIILANLRLVVSPQIHEALESLYLDHQRLSAGAQPPGTAKLPILIAIDGEDVVVHVPRVIADRFDFDLLEVDDPAPESYYESHSSEHPAVTHRKLINDPDYEQVELR